MMRSFFSKRFLYLFANGLGVERTQIVVGRLEDRRYHRRGTGDWPGDAYHFAEAGYSASLADPDQDSVSRRTGRFHDRAEHNLRRRHDGEDDLYRMTTGRLSPRHDSGCDGRSSHLPMARNLRRARHGETEDPAPQLNGGRNARHPGEGACGNRSRAQEGR